MANHKIPITALTGFLGSGKTTLLNYILEHNQGLKIGVVVNDYGDINIDAKLVADQTDTMLELTNGCLCCSLNSLELDQAIGQFAYPGSPIDYIIIEASGLAEPVDLALTLRDAMGTRTRLDSIVAVLDAANLEHNAETHANALQQIEYSDFVIINKTDLVSPAKVDQIKTLVQGVNERVRIFTAIRGEVDVRLLLAANQPAEPKDEISTTPGSSDDRDHHNHRHLHDEYASMSFSTDKPLDPTAFQELVNERIPPSVYRAKGIVNLGNKGHRRKYLFHLVGKRAELTWTDWGDQAPITELVFIGREIDQPALRRQLEACIDPEPTAVDPDKQVVLPRRER